MNFRKLKKAAAAVLAAAMCVTMVFGTSVSAAEKKSVWSETKALTSAKYNSNYIKWVEKYSAKEATNTITFGKSMTKKFYESKRVAFDKKNPKFIVNIIDKETILSLAYKDKKTKMVVYDDGEGTAIYIDPENMTILSVGGKEKLTMPMTEDIGYDDMIDEMLGELMTFDIDSYMTDTLGVTDKTKVKLFKFKSNDKIYYYEEFEGSVIGKVVFLFNEKGTPIATMMGDTASCYSVSFSVNDSEFDIPKGYKDISLD